MYIILLDKHILINIYILSARILALDLPIRMLFFSDSSYQRRVFLNRLVLMRELSCHCRVMIDHVQSHR